jgi:hypothetical protein
MRAKLPATTSNKPTVDMTFGFPGRIPRKEKQQLFLVEFAKSGDQSAAAKIVGYSQPWAKAGHAWKLIEAYRDYVTWLQANRAQALVQEVGVDQKMVLDEMVKIAFANEYDYLVFYNKDETDENGKKTGRQVPWARRKLVHELTREQLTAVVVIRRGEEGRNGSLDWKWRDRDSKLFELGKHLGMFNEKIILEHRHRHLHVSFDLSKAPIKDLEALEAQFEVLLGEADARK